MATFNTDECCAYYIRQAQTGLGSVDLPVFKARNQVGNGWFGSTWSNFLLPLLKNFVLPKAKTLFEERVLPQVKRGISDFKGDIHAGEKAKPSLIKRTKETWNRIKSGERQHGSGGCGSRKRRRESL